MSSPQEAREINSAWMSRVVVSDLDVSKFLVRWPKSWIWNNIIFVLIVGYLVLVLDCRLWNVR